MKTRFHIARAGACLLLSASAASSAYAQAQTRQAAEPQAAVPATRYQSALGARTETAAPTTPDQNWVAGNQTVAATNSMALTMKPMASHAGMQGMQGMNMGKQDSPAMCTPGAKDGAAGGAKMSCCQPSCCCKDKMDKTNKPKEAT
jgi:hypothetical protein